MNQVVCDSSSIISISDNCLLDLLSKFKTKFVVPKSVERELVDKPLRVSEFEFKALRLKRAIKEGLITVLDVPRVNEKANQILAEANSLFQPRVKILHEGEAECLALLELINANTLLVDERTTRLLVEDPLSLGDFIQRRTSFKVRINEELALDFQKRFSNVNIIRSTELVAVAYEKGFLEKFSDGRVLRASLYALKFAGCAITQREIKDYLKFLKKSV